MNYQWFITSYRGAKAQHVKSHADAGIGYIVLEEAGKGTNYTVRAAFRLASAQEPPIVGRFATASESRRLDERFNRRNGTTTA